MNEDEESISQLDRLQEALAGTWSIERELGRGGMATVYLARDVALERPVAIKVLDPVLARDPAYRERFLREARTGARLSHPNIVPIYAVEEAADTVYIVMGLVEGESLAAKIHRTGPLPQDQAVAVLRDLSWALGYAHAMGTLHRDVTLDNVLIENATGRAMLVDFGIAAEVGHEESGPLVGTPAYLAPELMQGDHATAQSDLYALGVVAWGMLSGRLPFHADVTSELLMLHLTQPVPSLTKAAPGTSPRLVKAIERTLAKSPADRPGSVEEWQSVLELKTIEVAVAGPLERWTAQWDQVKAFYALACSLMAMIMVVDSRASGYLMAGVVCSVAAIHRTVSLRLFRNLVRAGYNVEDLRLALRRRVRERTAGSHGPTPAIVQGVESVRRVALLTLIVTFAIGFLYSLGDYRSEVSHFLHNLLRSFEELRLIEIAYVTFWASLSLRSILPGPSSPVGLLIQGFRLRFWNSPLGALRFRLGAFGTRRQALPEMTLHRPTELVLDLAIEELWRALPAPVRHDSRHLPETARALRRRVAESRDTLASFDRGAFAAPTEATALRQRLVARQQEGIAALERLRLLLGGLDAASAPFVTSQLTQQLAAARDIEVALLVELDVHEDLRRHARRQSRATPSPSLTPA